MRLLAMRLLFLSSAICSVALHRSRDDDDRAGRPWQAVLILGCSVDRYAVEDVYGPAPLRHSNNWRVVYDSKYKMSLLYMFHRGVGINGDMRPPFYVSQNQKDNMGASTKEVISELAPRFSKAQMSKAEPDVVVVDSSLWDLSGWSQVSKKSYNVSRRVERWCKKDLPGLLKLVSETFKSSQIVFRTAPPLATKSNRGSVSIGVEIMYQQCIASHTSGGKLFKQYDVLDYHKLMADLVAKLPAGVGKVEDLWRADQYHPGPVPGKLYIQKIRDLARPGQAQARHTDLPGPPPAPADVADVEQRLGEGGDDPFAVG